MILLKNYLKNRKRRVVLNSQISLQNNTLVHITQGFVLGPLLFLIYIYIYIYINDSPKGVTSTCNTFADNTSLFSRIENKEVPPGQVNKDLKVISNCADQWTMLFNLDPISKP